MHLYNNYYLHPEEFKKHLELIEEKIKNEKNGIELLDNIDIICKNRSKMVFSHLSNYEYNKCFNQLLNSASLCETILELDKHSLLYNEEKLYIFWNKLYINLNKNFNKLKEKILTCSF